MRFHLVLPSGVLYAWSGLSNQRGWSHCHQCCAAPAQSPQKWPDPVPPVKWEQLGPTPAFQPRSRGSCSSPPPLLLCSGQRQYERSDWSAWSRPTPQSKSSVRVCRDICSVSLEFLSRLSWSNTTWRQIRRRVSPVLVSCLLHLSRLSCNPSSFSMWASKHLSTP